MSTVNWKSTSMRQKKTNNKTYIYILAVGGGILSRSCSINYCVHLNAAPQSALLLFLMPKKYATAEERREARLASKHRHYTRFASQITCNYWINRNQGTAQKNERKLINVRLSVSVMPPGLKLFVHKCPNIYLKVFTIATGRCTKISDPGYKQSTNPAETAGRVVDPPRWIQHIFRVSFDEYPS